MRVLRRPKKPVIRPSLGSCIDWGHSLGVGLAGAWAFNEGGGVLVRDLTGRGLTATLNGGASWGVDNDGQVVKLTGSPMYMVVSNNPAFNAFGTGQFSALCRVRLTATPSDGDDFISWDLGAGGNATYWRLRSSSGPNLKFESNSGSFTGGATFANGGFYMLGVTRDGAGTARIYLNGIQVGSGSASSTLSSATLNLYFGTLAGAHEFVRGNYSQVLLYNRMLTAAEMLKLYVDPWCMINQGIQKAFYIKAPAVVLTADAGSFNLTGQTAALKRKFTVHPSAGSYSLGGQVARLAYYRHLVASGASYSEVGEAVVLDALRRIHPGAGSFTLNGQAASLKAVHRLLVGYASYSLTGEAAAFSARYTLSGACGNFTVTGEDVVFTTGNRLPADGGSYSETGEAVHLLHDRRLSAGFGAFSETGEPSSLEFDHLMVASRGTFSLTGQVATLMHRRRLSAGHGAFSLNGQSVTFRAGWSVVGGLGSFTLTGESASLRRKFMLSAGYGAISLTGQFATLTVILVGPHIKPGTGNVLFRGSIAHLRKVSNPSAGLIIGSVVGGSGSFGYLTVELDAGEVSDPFVVPVLGGHVLKSFGDELILVEGRIDSTGSWVELSGGLDLTSYGEAVNVQFRVTANLGIQGHQTFPVFLGIETSGAAGWFLE